MEAQAPGSCSCRAASGIFADPPPRPCHSLIIASTVPYSNRPAPRPHGTAREPDNLWQRDVKIRPTSQFTVRKSSVGCGIGLQR